MLVRLRVGLNYSRENLILMLTIYALAALPFFMGGLVITLAISRMSERINAVYAADLTGAAAGCLVLIPLLDRLGAPGVVFAAAFFGVVGRGALRAARERGGPSRSAALSFLPPPASWAQRRDSTWPRQRDTKTTACCSASGIRSRESACTSGRTATGR